MLPGMSRASAVGKVAVLASSMLLGGAYIASQAGWVRLPFITQKRPQAIMASSKVRTIGPVLTSHMFDAPPPALPLSDSSGTAMMTSSKSAAVYPFRVVEQHLNSGNASNSTVVSPQLSMPPPIASNGNTPSGIMPQPALVRGRSVFAGGPLKLPSTQATTQPLAPVKVPSMNDPRSYNR